MSASTLRIGGCLGVATMLGILIGCAEPKDSEAANGSGTPSVPPQQFATPEEAAAALVSAAEKYDVATLKTILGSDGQPIVQSGDSMRDRNDAIAFAGQAREKQRIELDSAKTTAYLVVGPADWPLPDSDREAGRQVVVRRRERAGRDPPAPHRSERARCDPGVSRVRRGAEKLCPGEARRGARESVRAASHQHSRQAGWSRLAGERR